MTESTENPAIKLMEPVPDKKLFSWLHEFYGKEVSIKSRDILRHRDFSYVERIQLENALPESLIYKLVLPPWDIEQDLHQRVLVPSISSSAQLFMTAHHGSTTALFMEDLGNEYMTEQANEELAQRFGEDLAKMQRSYSYRIEELLEACILRDLSPDKIIGFTDQLASEFLKTKSITNSQANVITRAAQIARERLKDETVTLIHGDLYAENIVTRKNQLFVFDWSWFTCISSALVDVASMVSEHPKNGKFAEVRTKFIEAYCYESGRKVPEIMDLIPAASAVERLQFLKWLQERKARGVLGTTVGHVDDLITTVISQIEEHLEQS